MTSQTIKAIKIILTETWPRNVAIASSFVIFALLYMIPVWTTPGNTIAFHFEVTPTYVFIFLLVLALLNGLLVAMQYRVHETVKREKSLRGQAAESATIVGIMSTALISAFACAACYSSFFALLGLGATAVIIKFRLVIMLASLLLTLIALHYTARRVNNVCGVCRVG